MDQDIISCAALLDMMDAAPDVRQIVVVPSPSAGLPLLHGHPFDLVILDELAAGGRVEETIRAIQRERPDQDVLVLAIRPTLLKDQAWREAGACDVADKAEGIDCVWEGIRRCLDGLAAP